LEFLHIDYFVFSPDSSGKLFEVGGSIFVFRKERPAEAPFVDCKNGPERKNLQRMAGPAPKKCFIFEFKYIHLCKIRAI